MKAIINGCIIQPKQMIEDKVILFDDKIEAIIPRAELKNYQDLEVLDVDGQYVAPGFIDLHIHGAGGKDTMDATPEALHKISQVVAESGVTSFLPTTMTMNKKNIHNAFQNIKNTLGNNSLGAEILGVHMEGPFINEEYKGAQSEKYIQSPNFELIKEYLNLVKIITLAPEKDENYNFIKQMKDYEDIVLSIGHSNASYEQALESIENGVENITHLFNAMNTFHHRHPGILGAAFNTDTTSELIADTVHVHPDLFQLVVRLKGVDNIVLVTDSMQAGGMKPGKYELGGQQVIVDNNSARLEDGTLAGSILTLNQAVSNMFKHTDLELPAVVNMASLNPAQVVGVADQKGSIEVNKSADFAIFNQEFAVETTIVEGEIVYSKNN